MNTPHCPHHQSSTVPRNSTATAPPIESVAQQGPQETQEDTQKTQKTQKTTKTTQNTKSLSTRGRLPKNLRDIHVWNTETEKNLPENMEMNDSEKPTSPPSSVAKVRGPSLVESPYTPPNSSTLPPIGKTRTRKHKARAATVVPPPMPSELAKIFICNVLECKKRFHRSEHLKRHARSLHTLEKPYEWDFPDCNKKFSRRDNRNQHLRVYRRDSVAKKRQMPFEEDSLTKKKTEEKDIV